MFNIKFLTGNDFLKLWEKELKAKNAKFDFSTGPYAVCFDNGIVLRYYDRLFFGDIFKFVLKHKDEKDKLAAFFPVNVLAWSNNDLTFKLECHIELSDYKAV